MKNTQYFTTGEIAGILGVDKQTIIYYDKIGLLKPALRNGHKYRCYTFEQADELDSILTFRNLGVPLKTLIEYRKNRTPQNCIELLESQQKSIEMRIRELELLRKKIGSRTNILKQFLAITDDNEIKFQNFKARSYLVHRFKRENEKSECKGYARLTAMARKYNLNFQNPICDIIDAGDLTHLNERENLCFGILLPENPGIEKQLIFKRPAGLYITGYHKGPYDKREKTYARLLEAVKKNGCHICGSAFEMDLFSSLTNDDPDEYVKQISIPVAHS